MEHSESKYNCIILLGPTAVGKTSLGVKIADALNSEIISADSRQVYKGLDLGSGKDLEDYTYNGRNIPYHMIDITDLSVEYSVYLYQEEFYKTFTALQKRGVLPVIVGGTGMYLDAIVREYELVPVPPQPELDAELEKKSLEELDAMLLELVPDLHDKSDLKDRARTIKAIEIAVYKKSEEWKKLKPTLTPRPVVKPLILGTTIPREKLRENIKIRLNQRFEQGMIEEVEKLHSDGASWDRLERLGLEYRFIAEYLEGKIESREKMVELLYIAICQFAKRQETWFRGMEKKGVAINWLCKEGSLEDKFEAAMKLINACAFNI